MSYLEFKTRKDEIRDRHLEIEAEIAEIKRKYVVDKVETPFEQRVTLEAEIAKLRVEANNINNALHTYKKAESIYKKSHFTAVLIRLLHDAGMTEMVRKAERESLDTFLGGLEK